MKPMKGFEGLYTISEDGVIINCKTQKNVKGILDNYGVLKVLLKDSNEKLVSRFVHRLVALTYLPNPGNLPMVRWKNGDKTDVHVSNLYWSANNKKAVNDG